MEPTEAERLLKNLDRRVERIELFLPTRAGSDELAPLVTEEKLAAAIARLATKEELDAAVAPLATKAELAAAIAPLATKEELNAAFKTLDGRISEEAERTRRRFDEVDARIRQEGIDTRRHFDAVAEQIRDELKVIAEGHAALERRATRADKTLNGHDKRLSKLETVVLAAKRSKKR